MQTSITFDYYIKHIRFDGSLALIYYVKKTWDIRSAEKLNNLSAAGWTHFADININVANKESIWEYRYVFFV